MIRGLVTIFPRLILVKRQVIHSIFSQNHPLLQSTQKNGQQSMSGKISEC